MDLKEEEILGDKIDDHWYYVAKGRAMRFMLGDVRCEEVLDVGAGSGIFSRQLLDNGYCNSAVCVDPGYAEPHTSEAHNGKPISFVQEVDQTTQDLILMMDVLEHVPNDVALLKNYTDTMQQGGKILITVPAFQFLWSRHDVFLDHYRRYTISMLENTVRQAGLKPIRSRYFFGSLFPIVATIRLTRKLLSGGATVNPKSEMKLSPSWLNSSLTWIHDVERLTVFPFNKLMGLSVFCLCEK